MELYKKSNKKKNKTDTGSWACSARVSIDR